MKPRQDHSYEFQTELKPETAKQVQALGPVAWQIADRWLSSWRRKTLALEKEGKLVGALREQAKREAEIYSDATVGGANSHLARHEVMEMYGISAAPPAERPVLSDDIV
jgi:hypothetical protein